MHHHHGHGHGHDHDDHDQKPTGITITAYAITKVKEVLANETVPDQKLRIFVSGGGCSGFQYGFVFEIKANDDDTIIQRDGIEFLVDPMSMHYLEGAEIDHTEGLEGAQFVIKNPNAKATCGCGQSFTASDLKSP